MDGAHTTAVVQRYLDVLAASPADAPDAAVVRELLAGAARRLQVLCGSLLWRSYPRLTRPPLNLASDEVLGGVVERLLKALREVRPGTVRQFFALANQHMRWELNELARRLAEQPAAAAVHDTSIPAPESSHGTIGPNARRILAAIEALPEDEREVFGLVRIQDLAQTEVALLLGVSTKTVQRRLNRALLALADALDDPDRPATSSG